MKLSTLIVAGAALAGSALAGATNAATVFNTYGYNYGLSDQQIAWVTTTVALSDVVINGVDVGPLAAGGTSAPVGLGDFEYGGNPTFNVSLVHNGTTYTNSFTGVAGDCDQSCAAPANIGQLAVPEPATWAMLLVGVAGLGAALRTQRRQVLAAV